MGALTGLMVIAGIGLLKNGSLGVSRDLTSIVDEFNTKNISGAVQSRVASESTEIIDILRYAPSFMTGLPPAGIDGYTDSEGNLTVKNIPEAVRLQGKSLFTPATTIMTNRVKFSGGTDDVGVFASVYGKASAYSAQAFSFAGSLAQSTGQKFDDLGFQFKNYTDIASGGITSQFNSAGVPALAKEIANLGTMFSTKDLSKMASAGSLVQNLINQGLGYVGNLESDVVDANIDLENLDEESNDQLLYFLHQIKGSDLDEIIEVTNFRPARLDQILSLADVLDINKLFTPAAIAAVGSGSSLSDLSNKLSNIGGNFKDTASIGQLYSSLDLRSFPNLNALGGLLPDSIGGGLGALGGLIGIGSGLFGQPTLRDMTASASGVGYTDDVTAMVQTQKDLLEYDEDVFKFKDYLETEETLDPAELEILINNINQKSELQDILTANNLKMISCAQRLGIEKENLSKAGIVPGASAASADGLMNLSSQLHGLGVDPTGAGLGEQLSSMGTNDVYGEAVQASLIEGKNLGKLAVFGINPGTKMDPMQYANSLRNIG